MTNNELSRRVLEVLTKESGSVKFKELVEMIEVDARAIFKNLFFLEEKGFVQLSTRYGDDSVYPQILLVRIRKAGTELVSDPKQLDAVFPLSDSSTDTKPHLPPEIKAGVTFAQALELLAAAIRVRMEGDARASALEKIEALLSLPFIDKPIK